MGSAKPVQEWEVRIENVVFNKCDLCMKAFINADDLSAHYKVHKERFYEHAHSAHVKIERVDIFECDSCRQSFLSEQQLVLHRVRHIQQTVHKNRSSNLYVNENIPKPYQCPDCEYKFAASSTLEAHMIIHQPYPHICYCGIGYFKEQDLNQHKKLVKCKPKIEDSIEDDIIEDTKPNSPEEKPKEQFKVKFSFKKKSVRRPLLNAEVKEKRSIKVKRLKLTPLNIDFEKEADGRYKCPKCHNYLQHKNALEQHYRSVHLRERPYQCQVCFKQFSQSGAVTLHVQRMHIGEKNFECQYCDKTFHSLEQQNRHERIHTGYKPYHCSDCGKKFSDPSAFKKHQRIHTGDKRYRCEFCPKAYTDNSALYVHRKRHLNKRDFQCELCDKKFYTLNDRKKHVKIVHNRQYDFKCDHCEKAFSSKENLSKHSQIHNESRQKYPCNICFKLISSVQNLKKHKEEVHEKIKKYSCELCSCMFFNKHKLDAHMACHLNGRKFECDICNSRFYTKGILSLHITRQHISIRCKQCKRYFTCMSDLKKHKLEVGDKCDICDKEFFCKNFLDSHKRSHAKKPDVFECDYCGRVFGGKDQIKNHIARYHSKYRYVCDHCGLKFPYKGAIRNHMMTHVMRFRCNICYKRFCSNFDLEKHKKAGCTAENYECEQCGKTFRYKKNLKLHSVLHMENRKKFKCPLCGKEVSSRTSVIRHIGLMHSEVKKKLKVEENLLADIKESDAI